MTKLTCECLEWKPMRRNTLAGFAQIRIVELRITFIGVAVHNKGDKRWAAPPSKPWVQEGKAVFKDGKIQYSPIIEFDTDEVRRGFSDAVVKAVLDYEPQAFAEAAA